MSASSQSASAPRQIPLDWRWLLSAGAPLLLACALATGLWLQRDIEHTLQAQTRLIEQNARLAFAAPRNWANETNFRNALTGLNWQRAYLKDEQGAHVWPQGQQLQGGSILQPAALEVRLDARTILVIEPNPLTRDQAATLLRRLVLSALAALALYVSLLFLAYRLARRPWQRALRWAEQLEAGALQEPSPLSGGWLGALSLSMQVLAQRLRFSREALATHSEQALSRGAPRQAELEREIQRLQQQLSSMQTQLQSRSMMTSGLSHELRTPLTAIIGFSDLLDKGDLTTDQREYLQTIRKSAKGLVGMITDMLDVERIEAGRLQLLEGPFSPQDLVEDTISLLAPMAYEKGLELIQIVDHDVPAQLIGDAPRIQQILTNLVSNAIKFTDKGQVLVRVRRERDQDDEVWIRLQVEDSGIGLTAENKKKLFSAFERFSEARSTVGSGLGLTIVRRLTELMRGELSVESQAGAGSSFAISLPLQASSTARRSARWDALRHKRIWALEAHETSWQALQHVLEFWGADIRRFASTAELQRTLDALSIDRRPHLLVLGFRSDEVADAATIRVLGTTETLGLPAIALINTIEGQLLRSAQDKGADIALPKSCDRSTLYRACAELLNPADEDGRKGESLSGQRVLIAEDTASSRHYLKVLLKGLGADVQVVDNGEDAVATNLSWRPRFVLLDQNMPTLTGIDATRAIREHSHESDTVIIGMSAFQQREDQDAWLQAGVDALLPKPFDENQLLRCLQPWLRTPGASIKEDAQPKLTEKLLKDAELCRLIIEELPKQMQQLDEAFIRAELEPCRQAAHQLHGTASFFHLEPLRENVRRLEKRLQDIDDIARYPWLRDEIADVAEAVRTLVNELKMNRNHSDVAQ